jgi:hypothetical protein
LKLQSKRKQVSWLTLTDISAVNQPECVNANERSENWPLGYIFGVARISPNVADYPLTAGQTFAGNVTITALAAAVSAVGNGWSAQAQGDATNYGSWPSADLFIQGSFGDALEGAGVLQSQGALQCVNGSFAELKMHTYELAGFQWDARGWLLRAIPYTDPELLHPEDLVFPTGINNFRIQYTAGYTTVPEGVQEACAEWVAILYNLTLRDPALTHQLTAGGQASGWDNPTLGKLPSRVQALLRPYRSYSIMTEQG